MNSQSFSFFAILLICSAAALPSPELRKYKKKIGNSVKGIPINLGHLRKIVVGKPSDETGKRVAEYTKDQKVNPEELGEYAEGDILFPQSHTRNGMAEESYRWPTGVIPYVIDPVFPRENLNFILAAMTQLQQKTCIKFVPRDQRHPDYIRITNTKAGCFSAVGRTGGEQIVNLQTPGCALDRGTPVHELMHAIGFKHEQARYERDDYVDVLWHNIDESMKHNFDKAQWGETDAFGVLYDYESVMHYSSDAFSINGYATVEAKGDPDRALGQRDGLSEGDITKIRRMYGCHAGRGWKK